MRNKPFVILLPTFIVIHMLVYMTASMLPFLVQDVVITNREDAETWMTYCLFTLEIGSVISIPLWRWLARSKNVRP